jgi:hypothetical protein
MSVVDELPESWSEEKILEFIKLNTSGSGDKEELLLCLDELRKRKTIKKVEEVMELLLEIAKTRGRSTPESSIIIGLISRLANSDKNALDLLYGKMIAVNDALLFVFARVIRNLENANKARCLERLLSLLMNCDSFTNITEELFQTLVTIEKEDIKKNIVERTLPYLRVPDPFKVVYAAKITCRLTNEYKSELKPVIGRALDNWYGGH